MGSVIYNGVNKWIAKLLTRLFPFLNGFRHVLASTVIFYKTSYTKRPIKNAPNVLNSHLGRLLLSRQF